MAVLVLGVGNILLSDEGIGVHVVNRLAARFHLPAGVEAVDGGTSGMDLLDAVAAAEAVVIVDCADLGAPPGTVREIVGEAVPAFFRTRISPHQIGLSDLMGAVALLGRMPPRMALVAVQPASLALALELSPAGERAAGEALAVLIARLAAWGAAPLPRALAAA